MKQLTKEELLALSGNTLLAMISNVECKDCLKSTQCYKCSRCDACFGCTNSTDLIGCAYCHNCTDCLSCVDCTDCTDCILCAKEKNAKFKFLNIQLTEEEFTAVVISMEEALDLLPKTPQTSTSKAN